MSIFKRFNFGNMEWKETKTKIGKRKFSKVWAGIWLNITIMNGGKLFIVYGKEIVNNNLVWDDNKKDEILAEVQKIICDYSLDELQVIKDMAELGKREAIKSEKQIKVIASKKKPYEKPPEKEPNVFGDNFDIDD